MKILPWLVALLFVAALGVPASRAQSPCPGEVDEAAPPLGESACTAADGILTGTFAAVPFTEGSATTYYGDPDSNVVSFYGSYGNDESQDMITGPAAYQHYQDGLGLAGQIQPLCHDGTAPNPTTGCADGTVNPAIVFLAIGMSNLTQEAGGGTADAWDAARQTHHLSRLAGQPCSSYCPNFNNNAGIPPSNQSIPFDGITQQSLLYQVYPPGGGSLVGAHVVVWNGAQEGQTLSEWDPISGWYNTNMNNPKFNCQFTGGYDPDCNYDRVASNLGGATGVNNSNPGGYTEAQVQAIFLKAADKFPQCDLKGLYCNQNAQGQYFIPDAYQMELYIGDILRFVKTRYPNLKQVFMTSRIYGGYANHQGAHGTQAGDCENEEPFAYESGFAVQRVIVDQINQQAVVPVRYDQAGEVDYSVAPWVDWAPYLWASGTTPRNDNLIWCNGQSGPPCNGEYDVREGDPLLQTTYWGDFTHPTAKGIEKVADMLVNFMNPLTGSPWVTPWIGK